LRHLSDESLNQKLPGVVELIKNFGRLDAKKDLIPVAPSAHYTMGGIPTNLECVVLNGEQEVAGLMAIGEAACVSVHGANRLGCNSLLDLIVFGKIAGKNSAKFAAKNEKTNSKLAQKIAEEKIKNLQNIFDCKKSSDFDLSALKAQLQQNNETNLAVFRQEKMLKNGLEKTYQLLAIFKNYKIRNQSLIWNEELIAYFELKNLFLNSLAANFAALNRTESRGAHYRSDFKNRDDKNFHAHSLVKILTSKTDLPKDDEVFKKPALEFSLKPIRTAASIPQLNLQPKIRKY
jgi:succinate dehydrogenase / fumarate reductase flavoprotein subunit